MLQAVEQFFSAQNHLPGGFSIGWSTPLVWAFTISDTLIFLAYVSIPAALIHFVRRRRSIGHPWLLWMFGIAMLAGGATHLLEAVVMWRPLYGLSAALKVLTAAISVATAIMLWPALLRALRQPDPAQLHRDNEALRQEIAKRKRVDAALRLLSDGNSLMAYANSEQALLDGICRLIVESGGYLMAWVGYTSDGSDKAVRPVAEFGPEDGYLGTVRELWWSDMAQGRGPTGRAVRTGMPQVVHEGEINLPMDPWRRAAARRGYRSSIALPLIGEGRTMGVLNFYALEPDAFDPDEVKSFEELANNLAYGIVTLRMRALKAAAEEELDAHRHHLEELIAQRTEQLAAATAEAQRANEAKSRFLAAASHDLRQPLSALSLYVGALKTKLPSGDRVLAANMADCVDSLNEMLSDLLDLSKLDAGVVTPKISDFALHAVLSKVVSTYAPEADTKGLTLRFGYFDVVGRTDLVLFQRIIGNLVSNAIRYTERGGLLIGCRRRQGKLWVEIWDTGIGIPPDKTIEIFEEFKQLGNFERNRAKGSGLGLAIVAKTAALLGLQIRVQSRLGRGSMFAVELPRGGAIVPAAPRFYAHRPLRIALVEDNAEVAMALSYALSAVGHHVVAASSRAELLLRLDGVAPDIAVSDYRLGGGEDGFDVISALRGAFGAELPALVITGDTDPAVIRRMTEQRISVQHKPLDLNALRTRIAALTA